MSTPFFTLFLLVILNSFVLLPQSAAQEAVTAVAKANLNVRAGPGRWYPEIGKLTSGMSIILDGRNEENSWAYIHTTDESVRGWVSAAYLSIDNSRSLSDLPISQDFVANEQSAILDKLRATAVVPHMTGTALNIYQRGLEMGNNPNRFSKVGDCQNITAFFLSPFDAGEYDLGPYSDLQPTIDYFAGSFERDSKSVKPGFNVYAVLDPAWATSPCRGGENPLECEYRLWKPSFAVISLEITSGITVEGYEAALREVVDYWVDQGVVPIIGTKADNREGDWSFNAAIAKVAWEFDVPLWNFMMAAQPLPDFGLTDGFHLTFAGNDFGDASKMQAAWPWRNLTALQTLDVMRRAAGG